MLRRLPDLSPEQVVNLQDALLHNADELLRAALAVLDLGNVALARSLAILGMEESGKAIAVHERRVQIVHEPEGTLFRCDWLDALWADHVKKLQAVHDFLVDELYWFDVQEPDRDENAAYLGTIRAWTRRHDKTKKRGFYVEVDRVGDVLAPASVADEAALRDVLAHVHQIGWQLRLGEHIEASKQDEQEAGVPPSTDEEDLRWVMESDRLDQSIKDDLLAALRAGTPGEPLNNAAYRLRRPEDYDPNPFRDLGRPGYEAQSRELVWMADELDAREKPEISSQTVENGDQDPTHENPTETPQNGQSESHKG